MDNKHLHAILQEIWAHINCKQCNSKLNFDNIKLLWQADNSANFEIKCANCWGLMQVSAEMTNNPPPNLMKLAQEVEKKPNNTTSKIVDTIIKDDESSYVTNTLSKISSFKDIFWVFLICITLIFWWCSSSNDFNKIKWDIINGVEEGKKLWEDLVDKGKEAYSGASKALEKAPGKFEEVKKDAEKKINQVKDAVDKVNKASESAKAAIDAVWELTK